MKRQIGNKYELSRGTTPIWASIHTYKDVTYMTLFFTRTNSPRDEDWYKDIEHLGFNILEKGGFRYGYYYKILISRPVDEMQEVLDTLEGNEFKFKYNVEEMYLKFVSEKL